MRKYSAFLGISQEEISEIRHCMFSESVKYTKNNIIMQMSETRELIGIVEKGTAQLIRFDVHGNINIIDYYETGDVFGKKLSPQSEMDSYFIRAKGSCTVSFINFEKLLSKCQNNCEKHSVLLNNLLMLALEKSQMHIDILSQRSIKLKLITYFDYLSVKNDSSSFYLPLSLSDLADYLSVDRSAMMREVKKMKDTGIITEDERKRITVNKNRYGF